MARSNFKYDDLKKLQKNLQIVQKENDEFIDKLAKNLTARLLTKVIDRTPVGEVNGGTLRTGWTNKKDLEIKHFGDIFIIEIENPIEYASYVELGHRTKNGKGWVSGKFMLKISEEEIRQDAPRKKTMQFYKCLKQRKPQEYNILGVCNFEEIIS